MKRQRDDDDDVPIHQFDATLEESEAFVKLDTLLESNQIRQIMFEDVNVRWKVPPILNHLFTSINRFGINMFTSNFEDKKMNWNITRPTIFSKIQLEKLEKYSKQILVISACSNIVNVFLAVKYFFLIQSLLKSSHIHCLTDYVMSFLKCKCTTFYFAKQEQFQSHDFFLQAVKQKRLNDAKMQEIARRFL